jgi:hypothetical protein
MRGSEARFYADLEDMSELLKSFNNAGSFKYTETLSQVGASLTSFDDAKGMMRYLRTTHPQPSNVFLITGRAVEINTQEITMKDGSGVKIKADQLCNPDAVLIKLGGELKRILVATSINTTADTSKAKQTFNLLKKIVVVNAQYADGFYILPAALEKLRDGWRLTPDPGFSRTEDMKTAAIKQG